ncbi:hypothetical protein [Bacillus pseudomycoides]|uniref:hypothetical protein n=1 Tax=Bacillus pseudomycoides TaxID=64104 RepID=UPI001FB49849|nr:hypothetical protein [Bacillus pseudomycoides]
MDTFEKLRQETLVQIERMKAHEPEQLKCPFYKEDEEQFESILKEEKNFEEWFISNKHYLQKSRISPIKQRFLHYLTKN